MQSMASLRVLIIRDFCFGHQVITCVFIESFGISFLQGVNY